MVGPRAVQDCLAIYSTAHLECHTCREVGLDGSGDDVGGRSLGGYYHVDTHCTCQLGNTCYRQLYLLACCHDQVTELIDDYHYVGQEPMPVVGIELAVSELLVILLQVLGMGCLQQIIALIHLYAQRLQGLHHLVHIGDDRLILRFLIGLGKQPCSC